MPGYKGSYYSKEFKLNTLKILYDNDMNVEKTCKAVDVCHATVTNWMNKPWGQLELSRLALDHKTSVVDTSITKILDTKVNHIEAEFRFFSDLEEVMGKLLDKFNELVPKERKLSNITNAITAIGNIYIKAIEISKTKDTDANTIQNNKNGLIQLIEKQVMVNHLPKQEFEKLFPKQPVM